MAHDLILGGSGFIGGHLAAALAASGRQVVSVGRRPDAAPPAGVQTRALDLHACSRAELAALIGGAEVVYHLAWSTLPATAERDACADLADNVSFMIRLLESVRDCGCKLVFCSSGGTVYGPTTCDLIPEDHPLRPMNAYGAAKVAAETYAGVFRQAYGVDVRIARLANPYGAGQGADRPQGALARFAIKAVTGAPIEIWGDGRTVRDYLYIDDALDALRRLGDAPREALGDEAVFNIASGRGTSLNDLIAQIEALTGTTLSVSYTPARAIDVGRNVLAVARASDRLDWRPRWSLAEGVQRLLLDLASAR